MTEIIYTYPIDNPDKIEPMDRKLFYDEQAKLPLPTRYAGVIHGILINTQGEIILQRRADNKKHNPGMWDKSFGGHIKYGSNALRTVEEEVLEELGIPTFNSRDQIEFKDRLRVQKDFLDRIAIIKREGQYLSIDTRIMSGKRVQIGNKTDFFIGVSDLIPEPQDGEVRGTKTMLLEKLEQELEKDKEHTKYTDDLRSIIKHQRGNILGVLDTLRTLK